MMERKEMLKLLGEKGFSDLDLIFIKIILKKIIHKYVETCFARVIKVQLTDPERDICLINWHIVSFELTIILGGTYGIDFSSIMLRDNYLVVFL